MAGIAAHKRHVCHGLTINIADAARHHYGSVYYRNRLII
ncbi:hypothetical protein P262_00216 [Cronobacter malonaticus]|uniref:Uncharacterized protein n=1 Tax=Cronobacter malonaticus TaxID=413503 RepID=V5TTF5_9ENTR|nr:hypothetical protein P262_00216 [Cronobacter malonaticus]CCJ94653.1 hypothetical protein BN131_2326 [Cronobacter malonaticus 681]CCK00356.1 hypothetical protein BN130_3125 [Cronobacter malonaticus 507]